MIISRTPYRISFAGGGSDLPDFYKHHEGAVVSTTIDKYLHISLHENFDTDAILLKYSRTEKVGHPKYIKNTIARSILSEMGVNGIGLETMGDVPAKTGLGSSSAFAVGLHHILSVYQNRGKEISPAMLAALACHTEIEKLRSPIGKQDQHAAAFGGLNFFRFLKNGTVIVEPIQMSEKKKAALNSNLLLFYTGRTRHANSILAKQKDSLSKKATGESASFAHTRHMVEIAHRMKSVLEEGDLDGFGRLLHEGWQHKKSVHRDISNRAIDRFYQIGLDNGALGGKLLGAGGGGFMLFYCEKKKQSALRKALSALRELPFRFGTKGSEIVFNSGRHPN